MTLSRICLVLVAIALFSYSELLAQDTSTRTPQNLENYAILDDIKLNTSIGNLQQKIRLQPSTKHFLGSYQYLPNQVAFGVEMKNVLLHFYEQKLIQIELIISENTFKKPELTGANIEEAKTNLEKQKLEQKERISNEEKTPYIESTKHRDISVKLERLFGESKLKRTQKTVGFNRTWENENYKIEYLFPFEKKIIFTYKKSYDEAVKKSSYAFEFDANGPVLHIEESTKKITLKEGNQWGVIQFHISNIGKEPLVIKHAKAFNKTDVPDFFDHQNSTTLIIPSSYPRDPLFPDEKGVIEVKYKNRRFMKGKSYQVYIETNAKDIRTNVKEKSYKRPHAILTLNFE